MYFYQKLQNIRKEKRITQEELADKLNVSRQAVSKWESGQTMPEIEKIIQIAKMYDVSLDYLLKDEDENVEINNQISNLPLNSETQPSKKRNNVFIIGIILLVIGFTGVISFYFMYIFSNINKEYYGFSEFLNKNSMWIIFLICCFSCFIGLVLVCKNALAKIIAKIFAVYRRQEFPTKIGILLLLIGAIFFFVTLVYQMNQMQITTDQLTRHNIFTGEEKIVENNIMSKDAGKQLLGPEILLIVISAIVLGFVLVAAGIIKKRKGIFRLSGKR